MSNEITSTSEMAEQEWDGHSEPSDVETDMVATHKAEEKGIEFHVSMRDYTMQDMEALIIEAAARMIVGRYGQNEIAKKVQDRCMALLTERADQHLAGITKQIIDEPILPKSVGGKESPPVTMREFIGLLGREYLTQLVGNDGNPFQGYDRRDARPRLQYMVDACLKRDFKSEIEKATNAAIAEVQRAIKAQHDAFIAAEKGRLRDALAKLTGGTP